MQRPKLISLAIGIAVGVLLAATGAASAPPGNARGHTVRFDLIQIIQGTALAGGTDRATDEATGDFVEATGSGQLKAGGNDAAGGGTFVHRHADGSEVAHGVWRVTGLRSWEPLAGTFPAPFDGIGHIEDAHAGIAALDVVLVPEGGSEVSAVLTVYCHFPDTPKDIEEGISLDVGSFHFTQDGGFTLFHVL
jgi:hypothetical protein